MAPIFNELHPASEFIAFVHSGSQLIDSHIELVMPIIALPLPNLESLMTWVGQAANVQTEPAPISNFRFGVR
jgi:hypothetical protein